MKYIVHGSNNQNDNKIKHMAKVHEIGTSRVGKNGFFILFTMLNAMGVSNTWSIDCPCPKSRAIQ